MRFLRAILSGVFFFSYGLAALPAAPLLMIPGWTPRGVRRVIRAFYRIFVFFARLTRLYRVRMNEATRKALVGCRGKIIVANHLSLIDICVLIAHLPDSTAIAKADALKNPFLAPVVKKMFLVNDEDPEKTLAETRRLLDAGVNLIVFPQGTRGGTTLKRGAARLALAVKAPIATFHLAYDPLILTKGQPWWDVGPYEITIDITYNGEIIPSGESNHHTAVALTNSIKEKIL